MGQQSVQMIYDGFSFFGSDVELDLLDLKLHELNSVVNYFVIAEATMTHSGLPKPLYYLENKDRFDKFWNKIIYIAVTDMPFEPNEIQAAITPQDRQWLATGYQLGDNWVRERYQRNQIMRGLTMCKPEDVIIIEDADEIVKPTVLRDIENIIVDGSNAVGQTLNTYYMNWECTNMDWWGSKILRYKFVTNPSEHRFHTPASKYIYNGGWHFNFLGGKEAIQDKLISYAHNEFRVPDVLNNIEYRLSAMKDALGRLYQYKVIPIDENMPEYVLQNPDKFRKYMYVP
jgi:beta-1,4-mannosyl-glycoprotein beta-1,4-N-acetylglucosaminyltransferase